MPPTPNHVRHPCRRRLIQTGEFDRTGSAVWFDAHALFFGAGSACCQRVRRPRGSAAPNDHPTALVDSHNVAAPTTHHPTQKAQNQTLTPPTRGKIYNPAAVRSMRAAQCDLCHCERGRRLLLPVLQDAASSAGLEPPDAWQRPNGCERACVALRPAERPGQRALQAAAVRRGGRPVHAGAGRRVHGRGARRAAQQPRHGVAARGRHRGGDQRSCASDPHRSLVPRGVSERLRRCRMRPPCWRSSRPT